MKKVLLFFLILSFYCSLPLLAADKKFSEKNNFHDKIILFDKDEWQKLKDKISQFEVSDPDVAASMKKDLIESLTEDDNLLAEVKDIDPGIEEDLKKWREEFKDEAEMKQREEQDARDRVFEEQYERDSEKDFQRQENQLGR